MVASTNAVAYHGGVFAPAHALSVRQVSPSNVLASRSASVSTTADGLAPPYRVSGSEDVGIEQAAGDEVLDLLLRLVEQSLVFVDTRPDGETRYRMLEPVREYARERLEERGEAEEARERHARHYLRLALEAEPELEGPRQAWWLRLLGEEIDNLRAVFGRLLERSATEDVVRILFCLQQFWSIRGYQAEVRRWIEAALRSREKLSPEGLARALWVCGQMATGQGDHQAAEAYCTESRALYLAVGDSNGAARPALGLALVALARRESRRAEEYLRESAEAAQAAGDMYWAALSLNALGRVSLVQNDLQRARSLLEQGLALSLKAGDGFSRSIVLYNQSILARAESNYDGAAALFKQVLALSYEAGDNANAAYCLEGLADVAITQGWNERGAVLLGAAHSVRQAVGTSGYTYRTERPVYEPAIAGARGARQSRLDAGVAARGAPHARPGGCVR